MPRNFPQELHPSIGLYFSENCLMSPDFAFKAVVGETMPAYLNKVFIICFRDSGTKYFILTFNTD